MIDTLRHGLAVFMVVVLPPIWLMWWLIHPFVRFWRRLGPTLTYVAITVIILVPVVALWRVREHLLLADFGASRLTTALGIACLAVATYLFREMRQQLKIPVQSGLPELDLQREQVLLTEGIYGRIRHPRYAEVWLALLGWALLANHAGAYAAVLYCLPAIWLTVHFEEKELRDRFGQAYVDYCERVPRYWPRRKAG